MKLHFFLPWALLSFLIFVEQPLVKPQNQDELNSVEEGMGDGGRNTVQVIRADYILSLLFLIEGSGEYLGDFRRSVGGDSFHGAVFDGLALFPEFKADHYLISVDCDGQLIDTTLKTDGKTVAPPSFT